MGGPGRDCVLQIEMRRDYRTMTFLKKGKGRFIARMMATAMSIAMLMGTALSVQAATYYKGTAKTKVNLREAPSSKAAKAGALEKGDEVVLVANVKTGNVVNGYTADMAFFKLSTGEYVASQYITAGEAIDSDAVDSGGNDDSDVPDESGETEEDLVADDAGGDELEEIDLDTGDITKVDGGGDDLEPLDASDDEGESDDGELDTAT